MRYLLISCILFSATLKAETLYCISNDSRYEIKADLNLQENKVKRMVYLNNGREYKEFKNLNLKVTKDLFYEVSFNGDYFYLELKQNSHPPLNELSGRFIPRNSPLSIERFLNCKIY